MMAKDPAFLFYPEKFIFGTMFMTDENVGKYIRLLCVQHQCGGFIDKDDFNSTVKDNKKLRNKFVETKDGFYNKTLTDIMVQRQKKSSNLSANALIRWNKDKQMLCKSNAIADTNVMPTKDRDRNRNKDESIIGNIIVKEIIDDLNNLMSTNYRTSSKKTQSLINARLKEDFTLDDFKTVHRKMFDCWFNDSKMAKFLRPETLYGNKFESYLNQKEVNTSMSDVSIHNKKVIENWIRKKENED